MTKKIIIELKVIELKEVENNDYHKTKSLKPEENKIKLEVDSYEKAEAKANAFFKMLGL